MFYCAAKKSLCLALAIPAVVFTSTSAIAGQVVPGCPGDVVPTGAVDVDDLLAVINRWGQSSVVHQVTAGARFAFVPGTVEAKSGDQVLWIWQFDSHTVTSGSGCTADGTFNMPLNTFNPQAMYDIPASFVGTIPYFCLPHCPFGMQGTINVGPFWEDANGSGTVEVDDLLTVINGWGPCN